LALIATLGLAQFSHETTSHLTQLAGTALLLYAGAALPVRMARWPVLAAAAGLLCLVLSGAPGMAMLLGLGSAALAAGHARAAALAHHPVRRRRRLGQPAAPARLVHLAHLAAGPVDAVALAPPARGRCQTHRAATVVRAGRAGHHLWHPAGRSSPVPGPARLR